MGYRGEDLDLRTARTWSATSTETMSGFDEGPPLEDADNPLWVDETLLDSANYAYDLAVAHRAREVRLEHLVHAFTRIDAAAAELEARGVRIAALRRESAVAIASDIPAGVPDAAEAPHRSHDLEDALRRAADHTAHAGRPAGVGDVVQVLIDMRSDVPASALLLRHLPRGGREFWGSLGGARAAPRSRLTDGRDVDRAHAPASGGLLARPAPRGEPRRPSEYTLMQGMLDRLAEIERAMSDRLEAVEAALANVAQPTLDFDAVVRRFDAIEHAVQVPNGGAELKDRLAALERLLADERAERLDALSSLATDVKSLVTALGGPPGTSNQPSIGERLHLLGEDFESHRHELGAHVSERFATIEEALTAQTEKLAMELLDVNEAVTKLNINQQLLAGSMDQWRSNDAGEIHLINTRIGAIQDDGTKRLQMLERLTTDIEALAQISTDGPRPASSFRQWLLGTEDWIKASWQKRPRF